jgi:hypothetical protein
MEIIEIIKDLPVAGKIILTVVFIGIVLGFIFL